MNQREAFSEELLSGYLDGQLSPDERRLVEETVAESPSLQRRLNQLRTLCGDLRQLPRYRLEGDAAPRVLQVVRARIDAGGMAGATPEFDELVSAYLDGELPPEVTEQVEAELAGDASRRRELQGLRDLCEALQALPRHRLDAGFAERVLRRAEREMRGETDDRAAATVTPASVVRRRGTGSWRRALGPVLAAAAMILVAVGTFLWRGDSVVRPGLSPNSPLKLASGVKDLLLVYEFGVAADDMGRAAFVNLLRLNGITFRNSQPVGPPEQASLLKDRYLPGAEVGAAKADEDEIELFLVYCSGAQADAVYLLATKQPPAGISSCSLNLTRMDRKGPLQRLCDGGQIRDRIGEAVQLAGKLRILSRQGRSVGAFGKIQVDPQILEPAAANAQAPEPAETLPDANGDIRCRLLLVVRFLKPVEADDRK